MNITGQFSGPFPLQFPISNHFPQRTFHFDFLARISHQPFVKDIPQRCKVIIPFATSGGSDIIPFATSGGSDIGKTNERLAPSCKGAKLMDGKVFKGNVGHQELAAWVEELGL